MNPYDEDLSKGEVPQEGVPPGGQRVERSESVEPLPLEDDETGEVQRPVPPPPSSTMAQDVCPNCGAVLPDGHSLLCLRCGFDLKTNQVVTTRTGVVEVSAAEAGPMVEPALGAKGRGEQWLPLGLAAVSVVVMFVGYLAGAKGLFVGPEEPTVGLRLLGLSRYLVLTLLCGVCGIGALVAFAWVHARPFGDIQLAFARMLGIVATMMVVTLLPISPRALEMSVELLLMAAVFAILAIFFYRLDWKGAGWLLAILVMAFGGLWVLSFTVGWALTAT